MAKTLTSLLLLSIITCGQTAGGQNPENQPQPTSTDWKTLDQSQFSIQYPSYWEADESGQMGTSFILFSPVESAQDKFEENVNLLIQDLSGNNIDLNLYTEVSEGQVKTMLPNSKLIESKRIKNRTDEYHILIYSGDQGMFHLKFKQYYWVKNNKAFVLTFTSEIEKFSDYAEIADKILNSFVLKK
jgi:hypothetical protein